MAMTIWSDLVRVTAQSPIWKVALSNTIRSFPKFPWYSCARYVPWHAHYMSPSLCTLWKFLSHDPPSWRIECDTVISHVRHDRNQICRRIWWDVDCRPATRRVAAGITDGVLVESNIMSSPPTQLCTCETTPHSIKCNDEPNMNQWKLDCSYSLHSPSDQSDSGLASA